MTPQEKNSLIEVLIEKHQVHGALNGGMGQRLYSAMSELIDLLEPNKKIDEVILRLKELMKNVQLRREEFFLKGVLMELETIKERSPTPPNNKPCQQ